MARQLAGEPLPRMRWAPFSSGLQIEPPRTYLMASSSSSESLEGLGLFLDPKGLRLAMCHTIPFV